MKDFISEYGLVILGGIIIAALIAIATGMDKVIADAITEAVGKITSKIV